MREPSLMYVRDLSEDGKSVEIALWVCDKVGVEWSPFFTSALNQVLTFNNNLQSLTGVFSEVGGIPENFEAGAFISSIPETIPKGFLLNKYGILTPSTGFDTWTASYDYYFVEGSFNPVVFPQFSATWYLSLQGTVLIGALLTYRAIDVSWESTLPDPDLYNSPLVARNHKAGIDVYTPKSSPVTTWKPYAERQVEIRQGFWEVKKTWVYVELLWTYPEVVGTWDMRVLNSQESIIIHPGDYTELVDETVDYPEGITWLPAPVASGTRRVYSVPEYARDEIQVSTWDIPFLLKGRVGKAEGSVRTSIIPALIPVLLDRLQGQGFGVSSSLRPVSITDKLLSVNGIIVEVKKEET